MSHAPGSQLGHFEIIAHIGAGGMGDVYKARDTRLNRVVAIKTSKAQFNERFTREARAIAALNHPNIATLYDVGPDYLVMEFVEGERVKGPLAHDEALKVARQIADAVEAAHDKGIIHRDLKPGNILQREDGSVKVLDFGLAKALEDDPSVSVAPGADSPTLTLEATRLGMILGTAAYMSPEQAKGKRADRRADIFSFGVVLYELLTGRRLFTGESTGEILAAVIKEEPKLDDVPERWRGLIARCLVKDPRQRLQAIGEARLLIEGLAAASVARLSAPAESRLGAGGIAGWAVAAVALIAASALAWAHLREPVAETPQAARFAIDTPATGAPGFPQISPDGRTLVFVAKGQLWKRAIDSLDMEAMPGTEGARYPFWSPDSKNIGFFQSGSLMRMAAGGGPAVVICPAVDGRGGTWNEAGVIVFTPGPSTGIYRVAAGGGTPEIVIKPTQTATNENIRYPSFLPDGQHFLYEHSTGKQETQGLYLGSLTSEAPVRLRPEFTNAIYAGATLLFRIQETLMAQPFDLASLRLAGDIAPVADRVGTVGNRGYGAFSASANGVLIYGAGSGTQSFQSTWLDRLGKPAGTVGAPGPPALLRLSRDGKQLTLEVDLPSRRAIFLQPAAGGPASQIAGEGRSAIEPVWSPDGTRIVFSKTGPRYDLFLKHLDGSAQEEPLNVGGLNTWAMDWSSDGKWIVFQQDSEKASGDIWMLPMEGDRKPVVFLQTPAREGNARFSPDGRWMAFMQEEQGRSDVFVQAISPEGAATGVKYRISSGGGALPSWRRDGKELFYLTADRKVTVVPVTPGAVFQQGAAQVLFELPAGANTGDVSADGQRFLVQVPVGEAVGGNSLTVVLNWQAALKK